MLRGEEGKTFLVQFLGPTGHFELQILELFWSLQVYRKKTDEKPCL